MSINPEKFVPYHCTHSAQSVQDFLKAKRPVFLQMHGLEGLEAPDGKSEAQKPQEGKEKEHRIPGVPIDVNPATNEDPAKKAARLAKEKAEKEAGESREKAVRVAKENAARIARLAREKAEAERLKKEAGIEAKKQLTEAEKKITDKFGGAIYEMDKIPGLEKKGYKNSVYINKPANPEKFVDKAGKPIPPRIICYFHGNGQTIGGGAETIMKQVEEMRAKGENVMLVMPQDNLQDAKNPQNPKERWQDMEHKDAFKDLQRLAENVAGGRKITDVSIASFSGGFEAVKKTLRHLREASANDPEAKALYKNINQLAFMDSAYGGADEFARWAADKSHTLTSNYTKKCEEPNRKLMEAIMRERGGDMTGISIAEFFGSHGEAPQKFAEFLSREKAMTAAEAALTDAASEAADISSPSRASKIARRTLPENPYVDLTQGRTVARTVPETSTAREPVSAPKNRPTSSERVEVAATGKTFVIGDSLTEGFTKKLKGFDVSLVNPPGKETSQGQSTAEMLITLRSKVLNQDVRGQTLLILGGTNDIFIPDSLAKIQANLTEIYRLAKEKGMHVIGATLPPLASSDYARYWARQTKTPYEKYNAELIARWTQLNDWIRSQKTADGAQNGNAQNSNGGAQNGPDEIIEFATALEDPNQPGSLRAEYRGEGGIHLNDYEPMAAMVRSRLPSASRPPEAPRGPERDSIQSVAYAEAPDKASHLAENAQIREQVPAGFGGVKGGVSPEVGGKAAEVLNQMPFGSVTPFESSNGKQYVAVKEWHYHEPGGPLKPWGWHPGVSILEKRTDEGAEGKSNEAIA
jgi:hypothetical protein